MDSFRIEFTRSASKDLRAIDRQMVPRIITAIEELANDPTPIGCKKLVGSDHTYRIRVGDYRVIYDIHDDKLLVSVIRVRHRRDGPIVERRAEVAAVLRIGFRIQNQPVAGAGRRAMELAGCGRSPWVRSGGGR